jgi:nucleotide-binding universal stress UspA family protein
MKTFNLKKILVPFDFSTTSNTALAHAVKLSQSADAELILVHIIERNFIAHNVFFPEYKVDGGQKLREIAEEKLSAISNDLENSSAIKVRYFITSGKVAPELLKLADENTVDLIVMGTHGVSGFEEFILGSNAARIVLESKIPVITIQQDAVNVDYSTILLPIDNGLGSREKVAETVEFAKMFNSKVMILGLIAQNKLETENELKFKIGQTEEFLLSLNIPYQTLYRTTLDFADVILDTANEVNANLIAIMTDQELDNLNFLIGPTAQRVVNHSQVPVLSVTSEVIIPRKFKNNPI